MEFFIHWLIARLLETGWPKTEGILRRRRYFTEEAITLAMQDVIRIGLALGAGLPEAAKEIAARYTDTSTDLEEWVNSMSEHGSKKWHGLNDVSPLWLRFCSLNVSDKNGDEAVLLWTGTHDKYYTEDEETMEIFRRVESLAVIAMSWGLVNPDTAISALDDYPGREGLEASLPGMNGASDTWIEMAQNSFTIFSKR